MAGLANVVQSVLTGSSRPNAMLKLRAFGLDRYLDLAIGGFAGSEVYPKGALLRAARLRAEEKYRASFAERATIYIADSPRDVEAARIGGATSVAVASGRASIGRAPRCRRRRGSARSDRPRGPCRVHHLGRFLTSRVVPEVASASVSRSSL